VKFFKEKPVDEKFLVPLEETLRGISTSVEDWGIKEKMKTILIKLASLRSVQLSRREIEQFRTQLTILKNDLNRKGFDSAAECLGAAIERVF